MLILLPPSESKTMVSRGKPVDLDRLSFPTLRPTRDAVLASLIDVSATASATAKLGVPASLAEVVRRNTRLRDAPAAPADSVYSGVLYDALDVGSLDSSARRRARSWIVVISALWGAIRLGDRIPAYRLNMCGRLPRLGHLPQVWQQPLASVLPAAARRGLVVDCRSAEYTTAWRPAGDVAERTVAVKVLRDRDGTRSAVSHMAKHTRGLVARQIVADGIDPRRPEDLADALAPYFEVTLERPGRPGRPSTLYVVEPAS